MAPTQTATGTADAAHLNQQMKRRVAELGVQWQDVCRKADVSYEMLRQVRRGERQPSDPAKARIEAALGWKAGSFDAVRTGGTPVGILLRDDLDVVPNPYTDPVERAIWTLDGLSEDERREYIAIHRDLSAIPAAKRPAYINRLRAHRRVAGE